MTEISDPVPTEVHQGIDIGLNAVIVAADERQARVLVTDYPATTEGYADVVPALPFGPFEPGAHRTMESGMRSLVETQTALKLGYVEQLYTFGDRGRDPRERLGGPRLVSIGYLALVRGLDGEAADGKSWADWYRFFPWEDRRAGKPEVLEKLVEPSLRAWASGAPDRETALARQNRMAQTFGTGDIPWNEELVLERYELLYEAGLVAESVRDGLPSEVVIPSGAMALDHRRILATGMGRLRSKIKYRPVVFELMPAAFTLLHLQKLVEALSGKRLHKQNFRRLVEKTGLVEPTGAINRQTGGRPAQEFRFRADVVAERRAPGVKLPGLPD